MAGSIISRLYNKNAKENDLIFLSSHQKSFKNNDFGLTDFLAYLSYIQYQYLHAYHIYRIAENISKV